MNWLGSNWIWLALGLAFVVFYLFGHGGYGRANDARRRNDQADNWSGASSSSDHSHDGTSRTTASARSAERSVDPQSGRSHHGC